VCFVFVFPVHPRTSVLGFLGTQYYKRSCNKGRISLPFKSKEIDYIKELQLLINSFSIFSYFHNFLYNFRKKLDLNIS